MNIREFHECCSRHEQKPARLQGDGAIGGAASAQQRTNAEGLTGTDTTENLARRRADLDLPGVNDVEMLVLLAKFQNSATFLHGPLFY